jgi:hypothetical protein
VCGAQLQRPHRLRQCQAVELLGEQLRKMRTVCLRGCQMQHARRHPPLPVQQMTFEHHDAALARLQEGLEFLQQPRELAEQMSVTFQLAAELVAAAETLARPKGGTHLARATGEPIERGELRGAEATRKSGARQTQRRPEGAHAGALQALEHLGRPTQRA